MGAAARRALWLRRSAEAIVGDEVWIKDGGGKMAECEFKKLSSVELLGPKLNRNHPRASPLRDHATLPPGHLSAVRRSKGTSEARTICY